MTGKMSRRAAATRPPGSPNGATVIKNSPIEETIEETFTFYRLPRQHHKHLKSPNMLERLNEEIKRRTHVVRIFPNAEAC
jgi:transposase-like protein